MFTFDEPGPCPVCGAAHSACVGDRDSDGIGVTRGLIVITQLPARDAGTSVAPAAAEENAEPPAVRKQGARPIRRPGRPPGK